METTKNVLKFEECETIEELDDRSYQAGVAVGAGMVTIAVGIIVLT